MNMKLFIKTFLWTLLFLASLSFAKNSNSYDHAIIFGDSLSDIGNVGQPATNTNPDGSKPLWINDLMQQPPFSGQKIYPSTHQPQSPKNATNISIDYAWGGAVTGENSTVPSLEDQVTNYLTDVKNQPDPNALFLIWGGGNDLLEIINNLPHLTSYRTKLNASPSVDTAVNNLSAIVANLEQHGVPTNHIFVMNIGNLADTPFGRTVSGSDPTKLNEIKQLTANFDSELSQKLSQQIPSSHIVSVADLDQQIMANPTKYGFNSNTKLNSCAADKKLPACDGYVFYDIIHPTIHTHHLIANLIAKVIVANIYHGSI